MLVIGGVQAAAFGCDSRDRIIAGGFEPDRAVDRMADGVVMITYRRFGRPNPDTEGR